MVRDHKFTLPTGVEVQVPFNQRVQFNYFQQGIVTAESSAWPSQSKEASCQGERYKMDGGGYIDDVVIAVNMRIHVQPEHFKGNREETSARFAEVNLPCAISTRQCATNEGTFIWKRVNLACPGFVVARDNIRGMVVSEKSGEEYFISNDKSLVRIRLMGLATRCDRVFRATPYEALFVFELGQGQPALLEQVEQDNLNVFSFIKNRDNFLYHDIRRQLEDEVAFIREMDCREKLASRRVDFFLQLKIRGLTSVYLGNGTFATPAGKFSSDYGLSSVVN